MDTKNKNRDVVKSQTTESTSHEPSKAKTSSLDAKALGNASGLPFELIEPISLDENDGFGLSMLVF